MEEQQGIEKKANDKTKGKKSFQPKDHEKAQGGSD